MGFFDLQHSFHHAPLPAPGGPVAVSMNQITCRVARDIGQPCPHILRIPRGMLQGRYPRSLQHILGATRIANHPGDQLSYASGVGFQGFLDVFLNRVGSSRGKALHAQIVCKDFRNTLGSMGSADTGQTLRALDSGLPTPLGSVAWRFAVGRLSWCRGVRVRIFRWEGFCVRWLSTRLGLRFLAG
jgi:hypothetical protein